MPPVILVIPSLRGCTVASTSLPVPVVSVVLRLPCGGVRIRPFFMVIDAYSLFRCDVSEEPTQVFRRQRENTLFQKYATSGVLCRAVPVARYRD